MTNQFRTLLMNLSYGSDPNEHIPKGFTARNLSGGLLSINNILFQPDATRATKLKLGAIYLELIQGAGLESAFTLVDDRITYDLMSDFNNFGAGGIDITRLYSQLQANAPTVAAMFNTPAPVDTSMYENIWYKHPNLAYKIAGLIVAYVSRLS